MENMSQTLFTGWNVGGQLASSGGTLLFRGGGNRKDKKSEGDWGE